MTQVVTLVHVLAQSLRFQCFGTPFEITRLGRARKEA